MSGSGVVAAINPEDTMFRYIASCLALSCVVVTAGTAQQKQAPRRIVLKEEKPGLLAQAKIRPDSARKVAMAQVPGGRMTSQEIENEDGKLVYTFDFKAQGKSGVDEVNVDANTGAVVNVKHESAVEEKAEKAGDKTKDAAKTVGEKTKDAAKTTGKAIKTGADTVKNRVDPPN